MPKRLLIVEDDDALRRMVRTALQFAGFEIIEATDGLTALNLIDERPPDLVVLDLLLPRLNGHIVQQDIRARAHTRHIPVVIVTGSTEPIEGDCVLRKPVSTEQLIEAVRGCLALAARARQS